jgi:hypothetical protein
MKLADIRGAFDGQRFKTADELAEALGKKPGKKWQRALARELGKITSVTSCDRFIKPQRRWINKKLVRVYDLNDFQTTQDQRDEADYRRSKNLARLRTGNATARLQVLEGGLKADGVPAAERLRRVMTAIEIERRRADNMDD